MSVAVSEGGLWVLAADEPSFEGHFPGDPILPGVAILAAVLDAIEASDGPLGGSRWRVAKFHSPARPGDALSIGLERRDGGQVAFAVTAGERLVADGIVAVEAVTPESALSESIRSESSLSEDIRSESALSKSALPEKAPSERTLPGSRS